MRNIARILCPMTAAIFLGVGTTTGAVAATSVRPAMQSVVSCVYNIVRSRPGVLSMEVYSVGTEKYVIAYKFQDHGTTLTGGIGVHDGDANGKYLYTNDTPSGQPDNSGLVELDFLGYRTIDEMSATCHLMPGFDDTMRVRGKTDPPWQKVDMPSTQ